MLVHTLQHKTDESMNDHHGCMSLEQLNKLLVTQLTKQVICLQEYCCVNNKTFFHCLRKFTRKFCTQTLRHNRSVDLHSRGITIFTFVLFKANDWIWQNFNSFKIFMLASYPIEYNYTAQCIVRKKMDQLQL